MKYIPIPTDVDREVATTLDGRNYTIRFNLNTRTSRWYYDISTGDINLILGHALVINYDLLKRFRAYDDRFPPGKLFLYDETRQQREARANEFLADYRLIYVPENT